MKPLWESRAKDIERMRDAGKSIAEIAAYYGVASDTLRGKMHYLRAKGLLRVASKQPKPEPEPQPNYKETVEILADGSHKSDKLLRMTAEQSKDPDYLLDAHGYDKTAWELVSARSNIWNAYSKQDGVMTLYASKITVKPCKSSWTMEDLVQAIRDVKPVEITVTVSRKRDPLMLEIPFYDAHFGVSDYEHYRNTQSATLELIASKHWEQILFTIGQDLLHNDDFRGRTSSGTPIEAVNVPRAWGDAARFYEPLIARALKRVPSVKVVYSKGNHDESMSWAFVQFLKAKFPQIECDDRVVERKVHVFHKCFVGITHGDKTPARDLVMLFPAEFPQEWSSTVTREIHKGHYHKEDAADNYGIMIRTLSTRNKTDQWHDDKGFKGAHKRFMVFEWSSSALEGIRYV